MINERRTDPFLMSKQASCTDDDDGADWVSVECVCVMKFADGAATMRIDQRTLTQCAPPGCGQSGDDAPGTPHQQGDLFGVNKRVHNCVPLTMRRRPACLNSQPLSHVSLGDFEYYAQPE